MTIRRTWAEYRENVKSAIGDVFFPITFAMAAIGWLFALILGLTLFFTVVVVCVLIFCCLAAYMAVVEALRRSWEKWKTVIRSESHPLFETVRIFRDRWETDYLGPPFPERIRICGEGTATGPTISQRQAFEQICGRFLILQTKAFAALKDDLSQHEPPLTTSDLRITEIELMSDDPESFSFNFEVTTHLVEVANGLYVDFINDHVEEAGWIH